MGGGEGGKMRMRRRRMRRDGSFLHDYEGVHHENDCMPLFVLKKKFDLIY
jgi:hypothetical protein